MSFELTERAEQASQSNSITPQIVLEIDGVETLFGAVTIKQIVKVGGFTIGQTGIFIGGQTDVANQANIISLSTTSTDISQTLNVDKGTNESISSMVISLVDKSLIMTKLITPDEVVPDLLGRKCKVWLGFAQTSWRDDYIIIFRGFIDNISAKSGLVGLTVASPDALKRSSIFPKGNTELTAPMDASQTTADVTDTSQFLLPYIPASGVNDPSLKFYVRIDDEVMRYESATATQFATITRGQLGTVAASHTDGEVESFYTIAGNAMDLALKLMLSGTNGPYVTDINPTNFVRVSTVETVPNSIFFAQVNLPQQYNPIVGDYISTSGALNAANNVTDKVISGIVQTDTGYFITIDGVSFIEENSTDALLDFRSQYDVYGENAGMALANDEVDIEQHLTIQSQFLSSSEYYFYIKDTIEDGKEFLSNQIYNPVACFSIPRKAQSSLGIHTPPIPGISIKTLDSTNIIGADKIIINRSINKNFYNSVIYRWEDQVLDEKFKSGNVVIDGTSVSRIPVGTKPLLIDAFGFRDLLSALNQADIAGSRRLRKYKFGAESITVETNFKTGFDLDIGDNIIVNMADLKISDIHSATRDGDPRLFQIVNKKLKLNTGNITLDLVDTNFGLDSRYCLISVASKIKSGIDNFSFIIEPSYNTTKYGTNEYQKWDGLVGSFVKVHNSDFSVSGTGFISNISSNTFTLDTDLGFTPIAGYIVEFGDYDQQPANVNLVYCAMSDGSNNFADGKIAYQMS